MKISRLSASVAVFAAMSVLAACGGGGGGGTNPPVNNPGGPPATNPPATNPPATNPPATNPPSTSPPSITVSSSVYNAYDAGPAHSFGTDNWQTNGVTASEKGDGDTSTGGTGSNAIDGISCAVGNENAVTSSSYHVHAFVGIYVNGTAMAVPDAIGMQNPTTDEPVSGFTCAYNIHTHADSGIVHVEDPTLASNASPPAKYNLQSFMDIWGQSLSGLAGGSGMPAIYVGKPSGTLYNGKEDLVNSYTAATDATSVLLTHHEAIWLVYGTPPAAGLPQVAFGISN